MGYIPIDANGVGTSIQKSTDGGVTWSDDETSAPFSLLLLDIAANNNNVAVIGALSLCVFIDGQRPRKRALVLFSLHHTPSHTRAHPPHLCTQ